MENKMNVSNILNDALIQWSGNEKEQISFFSVPHGIIQIRSKKKAGFRLTSEDFEKSDDMYSLLYDENMFIYEPEIDAANAEMAVCIPAMLSLDMAYRISGRTRFALHADVIRRECFENENFCAGLNMLDRQLYDDLSHMENDSAKDVFVFTREKEDWNFNPLYNIPAEAHELLRNLFEAKVIVLERTAL